MKLTGKGSDNIVNPIWSEQFGDVYYQVDDGQVIKQITTDSETIEEILENDPNADIYIEGGGIIVKSKETKTFDVTDSEPFEITIQNVSNSNAKIKARIEDH